jgi:uncharacterized protein (TIGR03435 family)
MTRIFRGTGLLALAAGVVFGQSAAAPAAFDVASVKASPIGRAGGEGSQREKVDSAPGSLNMQNVSLSSAVQWAFDVREFQVAGPGWLATERYDIVAKAAGPGPAAQLRMMLRTLLADRFQLALHRETKDLPVYALVVGKGGPKLREAKGEGNGLPGLDFRDGGLVFQGRSMHDFTEQLSGKPFSMDHPVIDKTGLNGAYDFILKLADDNAGLKGMFRDGGMDPSVIAGSLQEIGLKLEAQKSPVEILVVDHAGKVPSGN